VPNRPATLNSKPGGGPLIPQKTVGSINSQGGQNSAFTVAADCKENSSPANFLLAFPACNAYNICMQYTIRNVPDALDEALRRAAREQGKSLNEVAIEALARGAGVAGERTRQRDLNDIAGTWRKDRAFDSALAAQDTIDEEMWR
jgi:plasmid stability protein